MKPKAGKIFENSAHEESLYCGNHKPSIYKEKRTLGLEKEDLNKLYYVRMEMRTNVLYVRILRNIRLNPLRPIFIFLINL